MKPGQIKNYKVNVFFCSGVHFNKPFNLYSIIHFSVEQRMVESRLAELQA